MGGSIPRKAGLLSCSPFLLPRPWATFLDVPHRKKRGPAGFQLVASRRSFIHCDPSEVEALVSSWSFRSARPRLNCAEDRSIPDTSCPLEPGANGSDRPLYHWPESRGEGFAHSAVVGKPGGPSPRGYRGGKEGGEVAAEVSIRCPDPVARRPEARARMGPETEERRALVPRRGGQELRRCQTSLCRTSWHGIFVKSGSILSVRRAERISGIRTSQISRRRARPSVTNEPTLSSPQVVAWSGEMGLFLVMSRRPRILAAR